MLAYVMDTTLQIRAILDDFEYLEWRRPFVEYGSFRLTINQNQLSSQGIERGLLLAPIDQHQMGTIVPDYIYLIEQIEYTIDEHGKASENLVVSGRSIGGILEERLIIPPAGLEFDERTDAAETVLKGYVEDHAGAGATSTRQVPGLVVLPSLGRGSIITYQGRYQTIAQAIAEISRQQGFGWEVTLNSTTNTLEFDVVFGVDRAAGSMQPVYFDMSLETIRSMQWTVSDLDRKNLAVVAGKGEGLSRPTVTRFISPLEPTGFARREVFVDAQDASDIVVLELKGDAFLVESVKTDAIQAEISEQGPFLYRRDFDLGDIVTIRNLKWGLQTDAQIVGVRLVYEADAPRMKTHIELGRKPPSFIQRVKDVDSRADAARRT